MTIFDNSNDFAIFALSRTIRVVFLEATKQKTIVHLSTTKMRGGQQFDPPVSSKDGDKKSLTSIYDEGRTQ